MQFKDTNTVYKYKQCNNVKGEGTNELSLT